MDFGLLGQRIREEIEKWSYLTVVPIGGICWEERIFNALKESGCEDITWRMGSHSPGSDIEVGVVGFSAKSGIIFGKDRKRLKFSSFRTTRFESLEDKVKYFDNDGKNFAHYLIIARKEEGDIRKYRVYLIDADYIRASDLDWDEKGSSWVADSGEIKLRISKKMSAQFWIEVNMEKLEKDAEQENGVLLLTEIDVNVEDLGKDWISYKNNA